MRKTRLLTLLVLLLTAATGAWAQDAKHLITATYGKQTRLLEQPLPYATTIGEFYEAVTGQSFSDLISSMSALEMPLSGITSNNTDVVIIGELNGASTPVTVKADGKATVALIFGSYAQGIFVSVTPPLYVTLKDGVKDADKWTVKVGEGQAQALPIGGLKGDGSETVTLQYTGRLKVKGVKATSDAAAPSVPDGALSGVFSVSDTKQVYFSKGNLQATYNGSNWSWAFAEHQWDYIGNAAGNTKVTESSPYISENATVDLFGWVGAACAWTGAAQYGISNVKTAAQYGYVEGEALKSDWGTLAITNGGNTANFGWRTLTAGDDSGEWEYLFKTRTTPSGVRYAHATVNDVPGLVLLPDDWSTDYYSLNNVNDANGTAYTDNVISSSDWTSKLEAHGAVFLPAGGNRNAAEVSDAGVGGTYWSSTSSTTVSALGFRFISTKFGGGTQGFTRNRGLSVRLVREVATSDEKPAEASVPDGAISGKFSVSDGKQVYFSKGNLRYASSKWSFFDNQYDYYTSYSADAWDKFGWSTSATTYGMSTSSNNDDYSGDFVDWGATMGAGWRTLTSDEWAYLLKTRSASTVNGTENGRYAKAKVNNVPGIILFPDTYTHPAGVEAPTGVNATDEYGWEGNSYTAADWTKMESAGCVFLPAAGCRYGSEMIGLGSYGYYGSATPDGADYAYRVKFNSGSLEPANSINRCLGCSVRLVQEVAAAEEAKPAATVTTAPTGAEIVGVGKSTALVSGGVADGGTLMYAVTTTNTKPTSTAGFSDAVPTAKDITASGKVYVWYYVKADDTHSDSEIAGPVSVTLVEEITWNSTNISDLRVMGTFESYTKEGVKLSANAEMNQARWRDKGDPTTAGIEFEVMESGGYTFTAPTGKNFTKIEMTLTGFAGWDIANLGSGWSYSEDGMTGICKVTWKGTAASTVGLLTGANNFGGESVKSIVFYLSE